MHVGACLLYNKHMHRDESGFSLSSVIGLALAAVLIFFAVRYVQRTQQDNKEQAGKIGSALMGNEQSDEVGETRPSGSKSSNDQSQLWENPIRQLDVKAEPATVTFTATLPGSYQGTCAVELRYDGSSERLRFVEPLKGTSTCAIYVPTGKLADSKKWRYEFGYYSSDGRTYGKYPEGMLSL